MYMQMNLEMKNDFCINWKTLFGWTAIFDFIENAVSSRLLKMRDALCWIIHHIYYINIAFDVKKHLLNDLMKITGNVFGFHLNFCGNIYFWLQRALQWQWILRNEN